MLPVLYNKERNHNINRHLKGIKEEDNVNEQVFSELITYIIEAKLNSEDPKVFKLLADLYLNSLKSSQFHQAERGNPRKYS